RQDGFFAACETHIAGQCKLTSNTGSSPPNRCDRYNWCTAQTHQCVGQRLQPCRSRRLNGRILRLRKEVVMSQKKPFNRAVKDDHFDLLVTFERCDDFVELRNAFRTKDVEGRMIEGHTPISR